MHWRDFWVSMAAVLGLFALAVWTGDRGRAPARAEPLVFGPMHADLSAPVEYVLPLVRETGAPPVARRGDVRAVVEFIDPRAVASACVGAQVVVGTYGEALACTKMWPGRATVVAPNPCAFPWDDYAALLCHELGHVNGWTHEREDGA